MKKKIFTIGAIVLFLGTLVISCSIAQSVLNGSESLTKVKEEQNDELSSDHNWKVIGFGMCWGICINGDIKQGEGHNKLVFGRINANLSIRNELPFPPTMLGDIFARIVGYKIRITDPKTGQIYTKGELPIYVYLTNFTGIGYINDYHLSWGPHRAVFFLRGTADYHA